MAVVAVSIHRWHCRGWRPGCSSSGQLGHLLRSKRGESAQEIVGELPESVEQLLEEHEEWAERTETVAGIAAILSVVAAMLGTFVARRESNRGAGATIASPGRATAGACSRFPVWHQDFGCSRPSWHCLPAFCSIRQRIAEGHLCTITESELSATPPPGRPLPKLPFRNMMKTIIDTFGFAMTIGGRRACFSCPEGLLLRVLAVLRGP